MVHQNAQIDAPCHDAHMENLESCYWYRRRAGRTDYDDKTVHRPKMVVGLGGLSCPPSCMPQRMSVCLCIYRLICIQTSFHTYTLLTLHTSAPNEARTWRACLHCRTTPSMTVVGQSADRLLVPASKTTPGCSLCRKSVSYTHLTLPTTPYV